MSDSAVTAQETLDAISTDLDTLLVPLAENDRLDEDRMRAGAKLYERLCSARDFLIEHRAELTESDEITALTQTLMGLTDRLLTEVFLAEGELNIEEWANERYTGG